MRQLLNSILEALAPTYLQGTLAGQDYPETFFTFWNFDTQENYYSNAPATVVYSYWVYIFSSDPAIVEDKLRDAITELRANKFIVEGAQDAASDEPTHTGRMITVYYIDTLGG